MNDMLNVIKKNFLVIILFLHQSFFPSSLYCKDYWSGEVRTRQSILYGRIEVRMKSASASGITSTLFTYNTNSSIYNEIDIEIMGKDNDEVQYTTFAPDQSGVNYKQKVSFNPHAAFHVHAIEWTPDYVAWYVDGHEIHRDNSARIQELYLPQAIMMNFWAPNSVEWAGTLSESSLPLYAMYDWIKYYEYTPGTNNNFTLSWSDNFDSFDNNRWIKSTSTFAANYCDFKPQNVLIKDGYLLLCMTKDNETAGYTNAIIDEDVDAPYPVSGWIFNDRMVIKFSEEVDETSATNASNYITLGLTLSNPVLDESKRKVTFTVSGAVEDKTYAVVILNIRDLAPTPHQSSMKTVNVRSTFSCPVIVDLGNDATSINGSLKDQKWDETKEYGTIGGSLKNENGITSPGEYSFLFDNASEKLTFYRHRLRNGKYKLKLFLAETTYNEAGGRVFDIYVNGNPAIENLDIFSEAGLNNALEKVIDGIEVDDNILEIYFKSGSGQSILHGILIEEVTTSIEETGDYIPTHIELKTFPNPFNATANIIFTLPKRSLVNINVYNGLGERCGELTSGFYEAGEHKINFNGSSIASGIYFVTLETSSRIVSEKIVLLK